MEREKSRDSRKESVIIDLRVDSINSKTMYSRTESNSQEWESSEEERRGGTKNSGRRHRRKLKNWREK